MFTTKPATPLGELEELTLAFGRGALADMLGRDPDTITRYGRERRLPREVARTVDRFWYVVHRAVRQHWDLERARWFLLSIEPTLGRPPFELVRDGQVDAVVTLVEAGTSAPAPDEAEAPASSADPFFAQLINRAATAADLFGATPTTAPARVAGWHDAEPAVAPLQGAAGGAAFSVGALTD